MTTRTHSEYKVRFQYRPGFGGKYWTRTLWLPIKGTRRAIRDFLNGLSYEERVSRIVSTGLPDERTGYAGYGNPRRYR